MVSIISAAKAPFYLRRCLCEELTPDCSCLWYGRVPKTANEGDEDLAQACPACGHKGVLRNQTVGFVRNYFRKRVTDLNVGHKYPEDTRLKDFVQWMSPGLDPNADLRSIALSLIDNSPEWEREPAFAEDARAQREAAEDLLIVMGWEERRRVSGTRLGRRS